MALPLTAALGRGQHPSLAPLGVAAISSHTAVDDSETLGNMLFLPEEQPKESTQVEIRYGPTGYKNMDLTGMIFDFGYADKITVQFTYCVVDETKPPGQKHQSYTKTDTHTVWVASTPFQFEANFGTYHRLSIPENYKGWLAQYVKDKGHMNVLVQTAQMIVHQRQLNNMRTNLQGHPLV